MFTIVLLCALLLQKESMAAPEPTCTPFSYDKQLLEKMIRVEFNVNNMEKNMFEIARNVEDTLKDVNDKLKLLEEKEQTLTDKIDDLKPVKADAPVIAFHAQTAADKSLTNGQVIVFTKVNINEGGGYDVTYGKFRTPVTGIYHFTSHLCVENKKNLEYTIVVNDKIWASGLFTPYGGSGRCSSVSVTVKMQAGERAWVTIDKSGSSSSDLLFEDADDWNYFSGFLVHTLDGRHRN